MVPIKDASLVGRKIDCPKCKYRFVVEEPGKNGDAEDDDLPAKKDTKKAGSKEAVTAKRPVRDAAPPIKSKGKPGRRPVEEEDDDEPAGGKPSKAAAAGNSSTKLYLGLGLALFAVLLLGVAGYLLFSSKTKKLPAQAAATPPPTPALNIQPTKPPPPPPISDISNLLPNDTHVVFNVPLQNLRPTLIGKSAFETPGAFNRDSILKRLGVAEEDISRLIIAGNYDRDWLYFVVQTSRPIVKNQVLNALQLVKADDSDKDHEYYVGDSNWLDSASLLLRSGAAAESKSKKTTTATRKLLVRIVDSQTMVLGGEGPVKAFLLAKERPTALYVASKDKEKEEEKKPQGGGGGGIRVRARGQDTSTQVQTPTPAGKHEHSASYVTINPKLKTMLDLMESHKGYLFSMADDLEQDPTHVAQGLAKKAGINRLPAVSLGAALQLGKEDNMVLIVGAELNSEKAALTWRNEVRRQIESPLLFIAALLGIKRVEFDDALASASGAKGTSLPPPQRRGGGLALGEGDANVDPAAADQAHQKETEEKAAISAAAGDAAIVAELVRRLGPGAKLAENIPNRGSAKVHITQEGKIVMLTIDCSLEAQAYTDMPVLFGPLWVMMRGETEGVLLKPYMHDLARAAKEYVNKNKVFPRGCFERPAGSANRKWAPDQCVSWMVELLPYLKMDKVREKIDTTKSWQDPVNFNASVTLVPEFLNSGSAPSTWRVVYPSLHVPMYIGWDMPRAATHWVGMAGVGLDAARYKDSDPEVAKKMGVFGYERATTVAQVTDGPEYTIMMIQVPDTYQGPWIAGGGSTIRGVPETDSVRPFVSGVHDGRKGTFAIMCDGALRFIPETISDQTFKALCTIKGGEIVDLELEAPRVKEVKYEPQASASRTGIGPRLAGGASQANRDTDNEPGADNWTEFTSTDWGFSVLVPKTPGTQRQTVKSPQGDLEVAIFVSFDGANSYTLSCMNAPSGSTDAALEEGMKRIAGTVAKVLSQTNVTLEGNPGRELQVELLGGLKATARLYLAKQRLYVLTAGGPKASKFLDSFKLVK
jgi:hypothetical protein